MKNIWQSITTHILVLIIGIFVTLLGKLLKDLVPLFVQNIYILISKKVFVELLGISSMLLLVLFPILAFLVYFYYKKLKFNIAFGAYYDKNFNLYCRVCKTPLVPDYNKEPDYYSDAFCDECEKPMPLQDDRGIQLTISETKELLRKRQKVQKIDIDDIDLK